jgi:hypothetical protein
MKKPRYPRPLEQARVIMVIAFPLKHVETHSGKSSAFVPPFGRRQGGGLTCEDSSLLLGGDAPRRVPRPYINSVPII